MKRIYVRLDGCTFIGGWNLKTSNIINSLLEDEKLPEYIGDYEIIDERIK